MIPMVAFTPESGERPMASTTWPGRSVSEEPKVAAGAPFSASFSTARSVPASRPASVAEVVRPSGSVMPISSRLRMGVLGGDDDAGAPEHAARSEARPGIHGYHDAAGLLDRAGQFIGQGD